MKGCSVPYEELNFTWFDAGGAILETGKLIKARSLYDQQITEEIHSDAALGLFHTGDPYYEIITEDDYNTCIWANLPSTTPYPDEIFHLLYNDTGDEPPSNPLGSTFNWGYVGGFNEWYGPWGPEDGETTDEYFIKGKYTAIDPATFDPDFDDWIIID